MKIVPHPHATTSILILDDDRFFTDYIKSVIHTMYPFLHIVTSNNEKDFLANLNHNPSIVLIDYNLGVENKVTKYAHSIINHLQETNPSLPLVLISSQSREGILEEYKQFRNIDYLIKNKDLKNTIKHTIAKFLTSPNIC
jgi:DNA-binding NarL/FixJ family response regulator